MTENLFTVDADWLAARLGDSDLSIVDASWYLPTMLVDGQPRDGKAEFDAQHIPGAVYFDINAITEPASTLPHTLAPANVFAEKVGALGISDQDTIVVYDGMGLFSAARVWWNFRQMGRAMSLYWTVGFRPGSTRDLKWNLARQQFQRKRSVPNPTPQPLLLWTTCSNG